MILNKHINALIGGASVVIIVAGMHLAAAVLNPFLLALMLTASLMPILNWQLRKGWPRGLAIALTILTVLLGGIFLFSIVGASIARMVQQAPVYEERLAHQYDQLIVFLSARGHDVSELKSLEAFSPQNLIGYVGAFLRSLANVLSNFLLVIFLVIFLVIDSAHTMRQLNHGDSPASSWLGRISEMGGGIRKYLSITALTGLMAAVANVILMAILGVDFPVLWGFLSFLFNFIPNVGFILSVAPPALLALLEFGTTQAVIVIVGFILINAVVENVIKPRFMGQELDLSLTLIFFSLVFWSWVLGMIGAILAVPLTMVIKKLVQETAPGVATTAEATIVNVIEQEKVSL